MQKRTIDLDALKKSEEYAKRQLKEWAIWQKTSAYRELEERLAGAFYSGYIEACLQLQKKPQ